MSTPTMRRMITVAQTLTEALQPDIIHTEEFRQWFGASKVKSKDGNPLLCYHGTKISFAGPYQPFTHFGTVSAAAMRVGAPDRNIWRLGANITPVYLRICRPYLYTDYSTPDSSLDVLRTLKRKKQVDAAYVDELKRMDLEERQRTLIDDLEATGFDGLAYVNAFEDRNSLSWVIFRGNQVWPALAKQPDDDIAS